MYYSGLAQMLASEVETVLLTSGRGAMTNIALLNLRHWVRWLYPIEVFLNVLFLLWKFRRWQMRRRIVFDVHGAANLAPIVTSRLLKIPLVWHFHETVDKFHFLVRLGKCISRGVPHQYVVVAAKSASVFRLPEAILIPGAVDTAFWSSFGTGKDLFNSGKRLRILSVGNLNPLKGIDILLTALETVQLRWELIIVGTELNTYSSYAQNLREHAGRLIAASQRVCFTGWQSREEVRDLMAVCDVFILPSRSEACPIALLEAMAAGCVCIATDVGDVRDILGPADCGIVVPSESSSALAEAIERVAKIDTAERQRMGRRGQEVIATRYSPELQAERHLAIYKTLLSTSENLE
jgi:glycosyltransferase involved in cell wall biosynthesis